LYTNTTPYSEVVYARISDTETGCYIITDVELVIEEAPVVYDPDPLEHCDPDNDGVGYFDLTLANPLVTDLPADYTITYHETPENAESGSLPLDIPYMNINDYNQIIYVRVFDPDTGCYNTT